LYICLCNALTDTDVRRAAIISGARRPAEVFDACGCRAQCGTCAVTLRNLLAQQEVSVPALTPAMLAPVEPIANDLAHLALSEEAS
jgi:bacterioferritin-associated ferredoxin